MYFKKFVREYKIQTLCQTLSNAFVMSNVTARWYLNFMNLRKVLDWQLGPIVLRVK